MTRYVIDASVMGPLIFQDEAENSIEMLPDALSESKCIAPAHWRLEVANQVLVGIRKGRTVATRGPDILAALSALPVEFDPDTGARAWEATYQLADRHRLTIYDAAYLELAIRLKLPLISLDTNFVDAAQAQGVVLIGVA